MRKAVFWIHLVVGVSAGLVILVMSVTGVLLTYQRQLTAWADRAVAKVVPPASPRLPLEELIVKVRAAEPKAPTAITLKNDAAAAASFSFGREKTLFVDPYSGRILGEGSQSVRAIFQSLIDWHRWLGMSGENRPLGKAIAGACNLGFLFLVISGVYLWWPRTWKAFRASVVFDFSLAGRARDWNWHNAAGFWSAIPLFVVVSTAVFFSYPWATELLYRATGSEPPKPPGASQGPGRGGNRDPKETRSEAPADFAFATHWPVAERYAGDWASITLRLPTSPSAPLNYTIDRGNGARPDLRAQIAIDPKSGVIEKTETYASYGAARKIRFWVRWIHTGEAGGIVGQTIAGIASGAGALLVWTGFALAWRRFRKRREVPA